MINIVEITLQRLEQTGIKFKVRLDKNFFKVCQSRAKREILSLLALFFADDTCLCTENEDHLQQSVKISKVCLWFGLKISVEKTEICCKEQNMGLLEKLPKYVYISMGNT